MSGSDTSCSKTEATARNLVIDRSRIKTRSWSRGKRKRGSSSNVMEEPKRVALSSLNKLRSRSSSEPLVGECGVCLDPVKKRGLLDSCEHIFCYSCVVKWTKRSSNCPHCKREVSMIKKTDISGKKVESVQKIKKRTLRDTLDREEFEQRRQEISHRNYPPSLNQRARMFANNGPPRVFVQTSTGHLPGAQLAQQLVQAHQLIRDNLNLVSGLRGLQEQINNMMLLNIGSANQMNMLPLALNPFNLPTFAANVNVTVNGTPLQQRIDIGLSNFAPQLNQMPQMQMSDIRSQSMEMYSAMRQSQLQQFMALQQQQQQGSFQQSGRNEWLNSSFQRDASQGGGPPGNPSNERS